MAAVTAAVIGAVAAAGSAAYTGYAASQQGDGGGGGGGSRQLPGDKLDMAMRSYYGRASLANATKTYPAFGDYLTSGGDPALRKFDLEMPEMTPREASAFGFVGPHGEATSTIDYEGLASGDITKLTPDQILYLAKQRAATARAEGHPVGAWAGRVLRTNRRLGKVGGRLEALQAIDDPSARQQRRMQRLQGRQERLEARQSRQLHPSTGPS